MCAKQDELSEYFLTQKARDTVEMCVLSVETYSACGAAFGIVGDNLIVFVIVQRAVFSLQMEMNDCVGAVIINTNRLTNAFG